MIQQADRALYKVKRSGRNNYIYIPYLGEGTGEAKRRRTVGRLKGAVHRVEIDGGHLRSMTQKV